MGPPLTATPQSPPLVSQGLVSALQGTARGGGTPVSHHATSAGSRLCPLPTLCKLLRPRPRTPVKSQRACLTRASASVGVAHSPLYPGSLADRGVGADLVDAAGGNVGVRCGHGASRAAVGAGYNELHVGGKQAAARLRGGRHGGRGQGAEGGQSGVAAAVADQCRLWRLGKPRLRPGWEAAATGWRAKPTAHIGGKGWGGQGRARRTSTVQTTLTTTDSGTTSGRALRKAA
jgi:hypothetical protein